MTIALVHAYRATNRGDGWLVELSQQLIRDATGEEPIVYALDPTGMGDRARAVIPSPFRLRAGISAMTSVAARSARIGRSLLDLPDPADLTAAIGLGGGYLRSADPMHELIFRAHHLPQLRLVAAMADRGAYLPVSVGPFRRGLGRTVRRQLASVSWVATRDDRSQRYLTGWAAAQRTPDLAACRLGIDRPELRCGDHGVIGVALRSLARTDIGFDAVADLERRGYRIRLGVQSSSGRTNDDRSFYADHGVLAEAEDFGTLLSTGPRPSVVLAGRLHAALAAIAAGYPTVHVGYERKSAGAFADLGLSDYVVDAWSGRPELVADLVAGLADDPRPYWDRLADHFDDLARAWDRLAGQVAQLSEPATRRRQASPGHLVAAALPEVPDHSTAAR